MRPAVSEVGKAATEIVQIRRNAAPVRFSPIGWADYVDALAYATVAAEVRLFRLFLSAAEGRAATSGARKTRRGLVRVRASGLEASSPVRCRRRYSTATTAAFSRATNLVRKVGPSLAGEQLSFWPSKAALVRKARHICIRKQ